jgi:hypothetical protein
LGLGLFTAAGAQAQTALPDGVTGDTSLTVTVGAWQVVISGCALTLQGTAQTHAGGTAGADCSSEAVVATVLGNGSLSLKFENLNTANPIFSDTAGQGISDMSLQEVVTHTGTPLINAVTITATGYSPAGLFSDVSASQTITAPVAYAADAPTIAAGAGTPTSPASASIVQAIAATNTLSLTKDFHVAETTSGNAGLNTVTQVFNVPEPASLALLAIGFAGLIGARRKRARG